MRKQIAVIIVNYNGEKVQDECLQSLLNQTLQNFDVIMIDNGSIDNSVNNAKAIYKDIIVIETYSNNGVAKGNNIGIQYAMSQNYEYILLLNNDTVLHDKLIELLIFECNEQYITVPKIFFHHEKDVLWYAGGNIDYNRGLGKHWGYLKKDIGQYNSKKIITYAPTCCMLIPVNFLKIIGIMDENYFMYYDDTDFCMRLNIELGKTSMLYIPEAMLWHKVSSTAGLNSALSIYYCNRNRFYFLKKFKNFFPKKAMIYTYITRIIRYIISLIVKSNDRYIKRAYEDFKKNMMGYRIL